MDSRRKVLISGGKELWGAKTPSVMDPLKNPDPTERIMALFRDENDHVNRY